MSTFACAPPLMPQDVKTAATAFGGAAAANNNMLRAVPMQLPTMHHSPHHRSALDEEHTTRSIHLPSPSSGNIASSHPYSLTASITSSAPSSAFKGPAHWQQTSSPLPPHPSASSSFAPSVPACSGLGASLRAHKLQQQSPPPPPTVVSAAVLHPSSSDTSPSSSSAAMATPSLARTVSVPSSSGSSAVSFASGFGGDLADATSVAPGSGNGSISAAPSPLSSSLASMVPPCPISLWWGIEDDQHARCVLARYAATLDLYTELKPGCRRPIEFIGRVRRDRIDLTRLRRHIEQFRAQHKFAANNNGRSLRSSPLSLGSSFSPSSSPCFRGGMMPALPSSLLLDRSAPFVLPAAGSFVTLDCVSVYSRDTLPLGVSFPLIRHEWLCTVWNEQDGVPEVVHRIHTEYNDEEDEQQPQQPQSSSSNSEDAEDSLAKQTLKVFARSLAKQPRRGSSTKGSPTSARSRADSSHAAAAALQQQQYPYSLTASITSVAPSSSNASAAAASATATAVPAPSSSWHPAMPQTQSSSGAAGNSGAFSQLPLQRCHSSTGSARSGGSASSSSSTPPLSTSSYLYCLPIFSEDCKDGCYSSFGSSVPHLTANSTLARRVPPSAADAAASSTNNSSSSNSSNAVVIVQQPAPSKPGVAPTDSEVSLGYAGSANQCIFSCMRTLGRSALGGVSSSNGGQPLAGGGFGHGGDDTAGEASTVVDVELEMRAMAAALQRMHEHNEALAAAAAAAAEAGRSSVVAETTETDSEDDDDASDLEEEEEDEADVLDGLGEDVPVPLRSSATLKATPSSSSSANRTGFTFGGADDDDDEDEEDENDEDEFSEDDGSSSSGSSSDSSSESDDEDVAVARGPRTASGSKAVAIKASLSKGKPKKPIVRDDDDDDEFGSSASSSFARSFGVGSSNSLGAGSLKDDLLAQLSMFNGGRTAAATTTKAKTKTATKASPAKKAAARK